MKLLPTCLTAMVLIAANMIQPAHAALRRRSGGRKLLESAPDASIIPGRYIVVFDGTVPSVKDKASRLLLSKTASIDAAQVLYEYDNAAIQGVSVQNVSPEHLRQLEADPQVLYIEPVSRQSFCTSRGRRNSIRMRCVQISHAIRCRIFCLKFFLR